MPRRCDTETNKKMHAMNFCAYRLVVRAGEDSIIHRRRHLFNQYVVDMYAKIESGRLRSVNAHDIDSSTRFCFLVTRRKVLHKRCGSATFPISPPTDNALDFRRNLGAARRSPAASFGRT
ncbi:hypothetical protein EVAR_19143_1 [Eumeta japonica]|uniref:Helitron helicase-like domain-containing protein n=1 Tax=Eumeta variegata TaxID=151549 RepID=A0A4C1VLU0_EUMVA|nr:hypothetical protein EVAR_19143_1 [Eumeta japonica]